MDNKGARIAELTEQLSLADRLLVTEMLAKAELAAEVITLRAYLMVITEQVLSDGDDHKSRCKQLQQIARNALERPT